MLLRFLLINNEREGKSMRITQIVYKVDNLQKAVNRAEKNGYLVEYGRKKNPYNAFIYFEEGPFIELMESTGMPILAKFFLKLFRKKEFVDRFDKWDKAPAGPLGIGIQVETEQIGCIEDYLKKQGILSRKVPIVRYDINGKSNRCYSLFPDEINMPFYVTKYAKERKHENTNHPNGAKCVTRVDVCLGDDVFDIIDKMLTKLNLKDDLGGELIKKDGVFQLTIEGLEAEKYV